jgi:hypothetical protein
MTQEALKLALDALNDKVINEYKVVKAITAIKEALAQLEQEYDNSAVHLAHCYQGEYPVCKYGDENCPAIPKVKAQPEQEPVGDDFFRMIADRNPKPFSSLQRTWVGLTDVEIDYLLGSTVGENEETHISFARAIESKLKEVNT